MIRNRELVGKKHEGEEQEREGKTETQPEASRIDTFLADAAAALKSEVDKNQLDSFDFEIIEKIANGTITKNDLIDYGTVLREQQLAWESQKREVKKLKKEHTSTPSNLVVRKKLFPFIFGKAMEIIEKNKHRGKK